MVLWFQSALTADGWQDGVRLHIEAGQIAALEKGVFAEPGDERHAIGLPGMPNLHSHAFQRGMAGLAEVRGDSRDSFWSWRQVMYRFLDRLTPEDVEAIAALAYAEMLEAGFTRVGEFHYLHHGCDGAAYADIGELSARIAAAAEATGIGLTLLPVFYAHAGFGGQAPTEGQRRFINSLDQFGLLMERARASIKDLPAANMGLAPHSLRAVTADELVEVLQLAPEGPLHIHVAEQVKEVEDSVAFSGKRPVEWLIEAMAANGAPIDRRWCLIHATHMTEVETMALAASGATAGLCPLTEANLGDGIFPADRFVGAGGYYGVGTDSNILIDVPGELAMLEYSQRLALRSRNVMAAGANRSTGASLFNAARRGGARALGVAQADLAVGAPADIVSLEASAFADGQREDRFIDSWIFAARRPIVDCVWRHGRPVVKAGRHMARDAIAARYQATLAKVLAE
ncbi:MULTISPECIES: formimidoylglutamate deiminase [unclassified Chelatococcus]|uniref:formimidoylglutamate deiminase n=1 Tax=unclassified Chelatococcus TaxID=2638111 RepID=UPI001BCCECDC|nr:MULTISPECIES: formimidoylglutamate deiminase [unclassified Chelatococcus]CAH1672646.1 Formiminoglutamic iminohydrolase [Hyphomicrobiales bacterium]MBS7738924.1 formimidoylglutamate deiminase [Chelatococcus sp. HY11]MBX3543357.1 formimidoylglutamate deiminase [Chelatococcus sp.]MCO5076547.1 formimidoylglutamate deiminase [Chelatococcus sp.]CAH1675113.1 Formiminoglutamic iminohydrolase [Hyphomicrobiales bacterium]